MTRNDIGGVFARTRLTLRTVDRALKVVLTSNDLSARTESWNLIPVFGRAVTNVLQHIRTYDRSGFNEWYAQWEAEMRGDPLCLY